MRNHTGLRSGTLAPLLLLALAFGCAKKPPQEIADANAALDAARTACAQEYAAASYDSARSAVADVNQLADEKKYRQARKASPAAIDQARKAEQAARAQMAEAKAAAEAAMRDAEAAIATAESADAAKHAGSELAAAKAKLDEAKRMASSSDCNYLKVKSLAEEAKRLAEAAAAKAEAEKRRLAEEARRAEEERLRREEEERLAREAAAMQPTSYTVQRGDSLWKISKMEQHYGDPFQWPLIFKANRSQIKDPDLIYPKQEFKIPRGMSQEEIDAAIREARNRVWPVPNFLHDGK